MIFHAKENVILLFYFLFINLFVYLFFLPIFFFLPKIHNIDIFFIRNFFFLLNMNFPFVQSSCFHDTFFLSQKRVSFNHFTNPKTILITTKNVKLN